MENKNKQDFSNTMEIDAILEEARRNRAQATGSAPKRQQQPSVSVNKNTVPAKRNATPVNTGVVNSNASKKRVDYSNDFVIIDDKKPSKNKKNKKGKKIAIIVSVIACVLVLVLGAGFCAFTFLGDFEYASNVYVNGIALGGLSQREAETLLEDEEEKLASSIGINVKAGDKSTTITKDDFTFTFNTEKVLEEAKQYSEENLVHKGEQNYTIVLKVDDTNLDSIVEKVAAELKQDAVDAEVTAFDSSKDGASRFTFSDEKTGIEVDKDGFEQQLKTFLDSGKVSGDIDAQSSITEPKYTKEYLLNNIKKLSTFSTVSTNNSNGNANMALSLSQCNNSIINPGEIWSFNNCTGDSNLTSNGYKPAGVIINGKSETGVGGGICQSSTTIYNATMLCGMKVVERDCHYYKSSYVDAGRDATVDYGNIDLKVENIFDYQLFMECYMEGTKLTCNMYGIENPEFDEIKISSSVTSYFSNGFRAQTSRTYYLDGKKVKTESLPNSTYYTSAPGGGSSSSSSSTTKPTTKPTEGTPSTPDPAPTPEPEPEPTPQPEPTPEPEPTPTPDPVPEVPADGAGE